MGLIHSFLGDVQRCLVALGLRAVWSEGPWPSPLGTRSCSSGHHALANRTDLTRYQPRATFLAPLLFPDPFSNAWPAAGVQPAHSRTGRWRCRSLAALPPGWCPPARSRSLVHGQLECHVLHQWQPNPLLCVPTRRDFWGLFQSTPMLPLSGAPRAWLIHGSTEFVAPPRGPVRGGGCAACPSADLYIPIGTDGTQDVGHSIALGILTALVATDPFDPIILITPLDYMSSTSFLGPTGLNIEAQLNYRSTLDNIKALLTGRRGAISFLVKRLVDEGTLSDHLGIDNKALSRSRTVAQGARGGPRVAPLAYAPSLRSSLPMLTCRSTWKATLLTSMSGHTTGPPLGSCGNIIPLASILVLVPTLRPGEESATTSHDLPFGRRVPTHVGLAQTSSGGVLLRLAALRLAVAAGCVTPTLHLRRSIISSSIALYSNATLA